jgi:hypothetical protein
MHLNGPFPKQNKKSQGTERETKMKNFLTNLMTSAVLLVSLGATLGSGLEAQTINMHAVVPFAWEANGHQLNAGDYQITKDAVSPVIAMRDNKSGKGMFLQVTGGAGRTTACRLVFHRYGDQYFLAEIVGPKSTVSRVPVSKAEKAVQSEQPREMSIVVVDVKPLFN